ncbi:hypothetical protein BH11PSE11_BH11PSE11_38820 [soil metagenome]
MAPENALTLLKRLRYAGWVLVFFLPIYWAVTYSGLYRQFSEMQRAVFGDYMGLVSWTLSFLIVGIPSIYLSGRIDAIATRDMSAAEVSAYYRRVYIGDMEKSDRYRARLQRNTLLILSLVSLAGGVGVGGYFLFQAQRIGPMTVLDLGAFNPALNPSSRYVETAGTLRLAGAVTVVTTLDGSTFESFYIPLVAQRSVADAVPASLVLKVKSRWRLDEFRALGGGGAAVSMRGVLKRGLPSLVDEQFKKDGVRISDQAWTLADRESPEEYRMMGMALLLVLGGLGAIGVLGTWWMRRKR